MSNVKQVLAAIPAKERTVKNLDLDKLPIERALGQQWDTETSSLGVKVSSLPKQLNDDTTQGCSSTMSSTFDALGMIGPVLLPAKRVLQRTCQLKLQGDEKLPDDLLRSWTKWREQLELLNQVNIPRCYFPGGCHAGKSFQLHHFSDASEFGVLFEKRNMGWNGELFVSHGQKPDSSSSVHLCPEARVTGCYDSSKSSQYDHKGNRLEYFFYLLLDRFPNHVAVHQKRVP